MKLDTRSKYRPSGVGESSGDHTPHYVNSSINYGTKTTGYIFNVQSESTTNLYAAQVPPMFKPAKIFPVRCQYNWIRRGGRGHSPRKAGMASLAPVALWNEEE